MKYSLDTNIFLRFLQQDDSSKTKKVRSLFEQAEKNRIHLVVELFIIIELAYALKSYFKLPKEEICDKLRSILDLPYLDIPERAELSEAVEVYGAHGTDFMDALLFVRTKKKQESKIISFDTDFDKLTPPLRTEP